ncbi:hypothetical protein PAHAL_4G303600 [Panicum hallii]|uniref:Uncharacterized protein n=1 Tax=Panicum hallii TaxID=206008 RepID=A0A2T8JEE5_9POAL|nr:hypothetical protein PAHAL_4G303600 [Panicum hallii]
MALRFLGEGAASRGAPTSNILISIAKFSSSFCSICPAIGFLRCTSNSPLSCHRPDPPHAQHQLDERAEAW